MTWDAGICLTQRCGSCCRSPLPIPHHSPPPLPVVISTTTVPTPPVDPRSLLPHVLRYRVRCRYKFAYPFVGHLATLYLPACPTVYYPLAFDQHLDDAALHYLYGWSRLTRSGCFLRSSTRFLDYACLLNYPLHAVGAFTASVATKRRFMPAHATRLHFALFSIPTCALDIYGDGCNRHRNVGVVTHYRSRCRIPPLALTTPFRCSSSSRRSVAPHALRYLPVTIAFTRCHHYRRFTLYLHA